MYIRDLFSHSDVGAATPPGFADNLTLTSERRLTEEYVDETKQHMVRCFGQRILSSVFAGVAVCSCSSDALKSAPTITYKSTIYELLPFRISITHYTLGLTHYALRIMFRISSCAHTKSPGLKNSPGL